jgi:hypothetical protein
MARLLKEVDQKVLKPKGYTIMDLLAEQPGLGAALLGLALRSQMPYVQDNPQLQPEFSQKQRDDGRNIIDRGHHNSFLSTVVKPHHGPMIIDPGDQNMVQVRMLQLTDKDPVPARAVWGPLGGIRDGFVRRKGRISSGVSPQYPTT